MNMRYSEKVIIALVIFLGVVITTGYIVNYYLTSVNKNNNSNTAYINR